MGDIGFTEILLILLVVVLLFGGRKIPEFAKGLGKGIKEFKGALNGEKSEDEAKTLKKPEESTENTPKT